MVLSYGSDRAIIMKAEAEEFLQQLHSQFLKENEHDEGDLIFYRINYRLADKLHVSKDEAEKLHSEYHEKSPRRISEGFCDNCQKLVTLIPIIYGVQESELTVMKSRELQGRLIIGDTGIIREGSKVAMFGCRVCKSTLAKYGTL